MRRPKVSRPSAPEAAQKRLLGMEGIRLNKVDFKIQLPEELTEHRALLIFVGDAVNLLYLTGT